MDAFSAPPKVPPSNSPTNLSTNPSMNSPKDPATSPSTRFAVKPSVDTFTDPIAESPTNLMTTPSMDSPKRPTTSPSTNLAVQPSVNTSTDPVAESPTNLITTPSVDPLMQAPADSSADSNQRTTYNLNTNTPGDVITDAITEPQVYPRAELMKPDLRTGVDGYRDPTFTMKPGQMPTSEEDLKQFDMNAENFTYQTQTYPKVTDISEAGKAFFDGYKYLARSFRFQQKEITVDRDEIVRFQLILDEFEQKDSQFPPDVMKRYIEAGLADTVLVRVLSWAIIKNLTVDGDLRYTLLPRRIVEIFRDLDCDSTTEHLILSRKWVRMTFGLMKGGLARFRDSDQFLQGLNRIRDFVIKLLGPYFLETNKDGLSFPTFVTNTLLDAMTLGYHILGHCCLYRWDWSWPHKVDGWVELDFKALAYPPPDEDKMPITGLVLSPALLKISDEQGLPLRYPSTVVAVSCGAKV